jgi:hypothetical protein
MAERKIVHVGQMKSGTTFIQNTLARNRDRLLERHILYPGTRINQQHACYGLCGEDIYWVTDPQSWQWLAGSLLDEIHEYSGDVIISSEALSCMNESGIERFVDRLGGIDQIIVTVRNLPSTILSAWQQSIKRGGQETLSSFFDRLRETRSASEGLWRNYSFGNTAKWWSEYGEVNLIVVESFEKEQLANVVLMAAGIHGVDFAPAKMGAEERNVSLRWEDVELLRRMNAFSDEVPEAEKEAFRGYLLTNLFFPATEAGAGSRIPFPEIQLQSVQNWAREEIEKIPASTHVHGDIDVMKSADFAAAAPSESWEVDVVERMHQLLYLWFQRSSR